MERADWSSLFSELTGYLEEAARDNQPLNAGGLLLYMDDLRNRYVGHAEFMAQLKHEIYTPEVQAEWQHTRGNN